MITEMNPIFTDNVLNQLSQLPEGTVISIGKDDIRVFRDDRDYEDFNLKSRFFKATLWVDEIDKKGE